jgi:hypothetical protein
MVAFRYLTTITLLLLAMPATASADCASAFESWVKRSEAQLRPQRVDSTAVKPGVRGSCVPDEAARQELLRTLRSVRLRCDAPGDASAFQTKPLVEANGDFLTSLAVCRAEIPATWTTNTVTNANAPIKAAGPPCLEVSRAGSERYTLANGRCRGKTVLAVVETREASGKVECKGYAVGRTKAVQTQKNSQLQLNYECLLGQGKCTLANVATMFPECDLARAN